MPSADRSAWFQSHYHDAARQVVDFFAGDAISLSGRRVADIGCGDGLIDLGVAHLARPLELVGFDLWETDVELLATTVREEGVTDPVPETLEFRLVTDERKLPCDDAYFDYIFSWSAFEHVADPVALACEIRRIMKPEGVLMVQVWPFFHTEHGSHLPYWYPAGFAQLLHQQAELERRVRDNPGPDPEWAEYLLGLVPDLNGIDVDDLQRALLAAGFAIGKVELLTNTFRVPPELAHLPLTRLGVAGVKLLAGAR